MNRENPIFRSLDIIEEKILERLTVENLADSIHFSKYHYQRMFRKIVGDSVMSYVTKRKLSLAGRELLETDATVIEVALKYGYDSHEGFTRSFKAYMGVSPAEYRKYGLSAIYQKKLKEESDMNYSRTTEDIIRELNELIAQAKSTAAYTRKVKSEGPEGAEKYAPFWDLAADRTEETAGELERALEQVTSISRRADGISARFLIMKGIEDAAFQFHLIDFHVGLMVSRAMPEHRETFRPVCEKYDMLAEKARVKAEKIAVFLNELAAMIFQDMRENAAKRIEEALERGRETVRALKDGANDACAYITEEIMVIVDELSNLPLEEMTVSQMEDAHFRMQLISFAADVDLFRMPSCQEAFGHIRIFRDSLGEVAEFLQTLPETGGEAAAGAEDKSLKRTTEKVCSDLAMHGSILLFYFRGELQKLGSAHLQAGQEEVFDTICRRMNDAIHLCRSDKGQKALGQVAGLLDQVRREMTAEADRLGFYGNSVHFLAKEVETLALAVENAALSPL